MKAAEVRCAKRFPWRCNLLRGGERDYSSIRSKSGRRLPEAFFEAGSGADEGREGMKKGGAGEYEFHPREAPGRMRRQTRAAGIPGELLRPEVRKKRVPQEVTQV